MNRFFAQSIDNGVAILSKEDSMHLSKVLRMQPLDEVEIVFSGKLFLGKIKSNDNKKSEIEIEKEINADSEPTIEVTLFQGLPKSGKMEFIIQKCVELGIKKIVPIETKRCVSKGKESKDERFQRVAYEACKQCKRVYVPKIDKTTKLKDCNFTEFDLVLVAYENEKENGIKSILNKTEKVKSIGIIIGPEGGFEEEEILLLKKQDVKAVSLGKRILRTETAGMAVLAAVLYHFDEMEV